MEAKSETSVQKFTMYRYVFEYVFQHYGNLFAFKRFKKSVVQFRGKHAHHPQNVLVIILLMKINGNIKNPRVDHGRDMGTGERCSKSCKSSKGGIS